MSPVTWFRFVGAIVLIVVCVTCRLPVFALAVAYVNLLFATFALSRAWFTR